MAMFVGCSICQEMFTVTRPFVVTRCGHAFDDQCLRDWLKKEKTCPTCRAPTHEKTLLKAFFSVVPDDTDDDKKCCEELNRKMEELQLSTVENTSMYLCQIQNLEEQVRHFEQEAKFMKNITMEKMKMMTSKNSDLERRIMELKMANQRLIDERNHFLRSNSVRERHFVELSHVLKQMEEEQRQKSEEKNILALNNFTLQSEVERLKELMSVLECGQKGKISEKNFVDLQRENKKLRGEMKTLENNHKQKLESMNKKLHKMMFE